jgi:hypothetical protein
MQINVANAHIKFQIIFLMSGTGADDCQQAPTQKAASKNVAVKRIPRNAKALSIVTM